LTLYNISSFLTHLVQIIFSIRIQRHIPKLSKYSKTCQVDHLHKVTTCRCWPHIGRTG
jgi:hypothetical protein